MREITPPGPISCMPDNLDQRIAEIINKHAEYMDGFDRGQINFGRQAVVAMLRDLLQQQDAREAEREACAKVADAVEQEAAERYKAEPPGPIATALGARRQAAFAIAAAIRSRPSASTDGDG